MIIKDFKEELQLFLSGNEPKEIIRLLRKYHELIEPNLSNQSFNSFGQFLTSSEMGRLNRDIEKIKNENQFGTYLKNLILEKGYSDAEVAKKSGVTRQTINKATNEKNNGKEYIPKKYTLIAIGLALNLSIEGMSTLLRKAGYEFIESNSIDYVIMFCLKKGLFRVDDVDEVLSDLNLKPLLAN